MDVEFVGVDRALHNVLTEPVDAGDEYDIAETRFGIEREDHPAGRPVGSHHLHDPDRERDLEMVEPIVDSIGDGPIGEDGCKAAPAGLEQVPRAANIEEAFVLAGKARGGEVLGRGGAAHGNGDVGPIFAFELAIGRGDVLSKAIDAGGSEDDVAGFGRALGKDIDAGLVDAVEKLMQPVPCPSRRQRVAVGLRREGEAVRHPDAPIRQSRIELAKRRVLSAYCRNVVQPNVAEPARVPGGRHSRSLICAATILLGPGIHVLTQINGQGAQMRDWTLSVPGRGTWMPQKA